jgi:hypothetical protein
MQARHTSRRALQAVLCALALLLPLWPSAAPTARLSAQTLGGPRLIVDSRDTEAREALRRRGATLLADYGPFGLWRLPPNSPAPRQDDDAALDRIQLRNATIDTSTPQPQARQQPAASAQLWLIQLVGPARDAWLDTLAQLGLRLVSPLPTNAFLVWGDGTAIAALDQLVADADMLAWHGPYLPEYRLAPALQGGMGRQELSVQLLATPAWPATSARLAALGTVLSPPRELLGLITLSLVLPAARLPEIAAWPDIVNIEPLPRPSRRDERQGQIIAGNLRTAGAQVVPSGPGYLGWLSASGFSTDPTRYPIVEITDDGLDGGDAANIRHPDFYERGDTSRPDRVLAIHNCTADASAAGPAGHGNLNAGIIAAYNNRSGSGFSDAAGYRYGLGVAPYARLAATKIFRDDGTYAVGGCGGDYLGIVAQGVAHGATISSNSWADDSAPYQGAYDVGAQQYDALTRDADPDRPGNQAQLHIFAAGNAGPQPGSVGTPGTAKNVLSIGASENVHADGVPDGCGYLNADSADDIASFSARGPSDDGRAKPDLVAPGIHVSGPATQPSFNGLGICGPLYPSGQSLYTWSSGTSHAAPAAAGAAALVHELYGRALAPGATPSPAMLKALLLNAARYLRGSGAGDSLPGAAQGWGALNLGPLVAPTTRYLHDQQRVLHSSGDSFSVTGSVADPAKPLRVTLVWSDAPGSPLAARALVNDLDLEVTVGNTRYLGNVFVGEHSRAGGSADRLNNVEQVLLPAGLSGTVTIRVLAFNIAGDGLPGQGDASDQDFALVASNLASQTAPTPTATPSATPGATPTPTATPSATPGATPTPEPSPTPTPRPTATPPDQRRIYVPGLFGG